MRETLLSGLQLPTLSRTRTLTLWMPFARSVPISERRSVPFQLRNVPLPGSVSPISNSPSRTPDPSPSEAAITRVEAEVRGFGFREKSTELMTGASASVGATFRLDQWG